MRLKDLCGTAQVFADMCKHCEANLHYNREWWRLDLVTHTHTVTVAQTQDTHSHTNSPLQPVFLLRFHEHFFQRRPKVCFEILQLVIKHVTRHYIKVIYRRVSSALQMLLSNFAAFLHFAI